MAIAQTAYDFSGSTAEMDFIGVSLNGVDFKKDLGILRVSSGSRFNEDILPTIQDKTVQVPGADGTYLFGSFYTQRQFALNVAYDSMTQAQFNKLHQLLSIKNPMPLIFAEAPFKAYYVKATGQPNLQYMCFDSDNGRVYRGEGTINLVAYHPYARGTMLYTDSTDSWVKEYDFPTTAPVLSKEMSGGSISFDIVNPGDWDMDWQITFPGRWLEEGTMEIAYDSDDGSASGVMNLKRSTGYLPGTILIDSALNIITSGEMTGVYNRLKKSGVFFKLPMGKSKLTISLGDTNSSETGTVEIKYNYLYY